jgi:hypothetical protein
VRQAGFSPIGKCNSDIWGMTRTCNWKALVQLRLNISLPSNMNVAKLFWVSQGYWEAWLN